ncbi:phosphonate C-P lyase system protein PhnH [Qingshengfaniella alkalisoli]|uniref:Phosphonate C-P lyase system protein PhnH n=1 Tax=Qingshengfaniella alkalisoli TaxID=2599296 RepID=A0A5B8JB92_9RHOB|nr:phosphonate C-P lyase system protein PhnH [Qingshengfaniella alkalisoli]QDY71430.1 phosphonate C-P lyase system protein PhnH [Qingshengfaniella alkalisoli]
MSADVLKGGFADPPRDAAHMFRKILDVMARPGKISEIGGVAAPEPLSKATAAVLLTMCDADTGIFLGERLDAPAIREWIAFHTGAPIVSAAECDFAFGSWDDLGSLDQFRIGTAEYPDRSATLVVELPELEAQGARLSGPGIKDHGFLSLPDVAAFQRNNALFPLGRDFIFTSGDRIAACPRSTKVDA